MDGNRLLGKECDRERRAEPRWHDRRLVLLKDQGRELPGVTADISEWGLGVGLPDAAGAVGTQVTATIAFAQELVEVRGRVVYVQDGEGGVFAGIRLDPEQERFARFVHRRYSSH